MKKIRRLAWIICCLIVGASLLNAGLTVFGPGAVSNQADPPGANLVLSLMSIVFAILAALILSHQPENVIGWLVMMPSLIGVVPAASYIRSFASAPLEPPVLLLLALWYYNWSWLLFIFPIFFIPVLFPNGRPVSARWRWLIIAGLVMCGLLIFLDTFYPVYSTTDLGMDWSVANPIGFLPAEIETYFFGPWSLGLLSLTLLSLASIFIRYRQAARVERQQIKWLLYACAVFAFVYGPTNLMSQSANPPRIILILNILLPFSLLGIPVAIAIAILRYRLWDIDVIIRRTLQYAILTGVLALLYFGSVLLGQRLVGALTGVPDSPLVLVVSTLLIAALFNPLRGRVQEFIDRRFYRRKYDALQTLAAFTRTARDETRLEALTPALLEAVQDSVQPEQAWLWLKVRKKRFKPQSVRKEHGRKER